MAVDGQLLRGEVSDHPQTEEKKNIEELLSSFIHALLMEHRPELPPAPAPTGVLALQGELHHER